MTSTFNDLHYFNKSVARDITWAHAVNSKEKLAMYLKTDIMMFEADVNMRFNRNDTIPIMAHPPKNDSDLTLEAFLKSLQQTNKGIKLDFKSILAVKPSMDVLKNVFGTADSKPLWLNADILPGPGITAISNPPVDAASFIDICTKNYPNATLSLGWTTGWSKTVDNEGYTQQMVDEMTSICNKLQQVITFPLRAIYVRRSWKHLKSLLESSDRYSITIWSAKVDTVDVNDLVWLIEQVDKRRLYMDLPPDLNNELNNALSSEASSNKMWFVSSLVVAIISVVFVKLLQS